MVEKSSQKNFEATLQVAARQAIQRWVILTRGNPSAFSESQLADMQIIKKANSMLDRLESFKKNEPLFKRMVHNFIPSYFENCLRLKMPINPADSLCNEVPVVIQTVAADADLSL